MAPQLRENLDNDLVKPLGTTFIIPVVENDSVSLSDVDIWSNSDSEDENFIADWMAPVSNDLRDLLVKVTSTEDLQTVTQLQLKVITREISLQQLSIYTPALRELVLDGSYVSSIRDLGSELKNLKVLRLNRCGLRYLDSVFGVEHLEELYAADNYLTDISACAFLPGIKIIDVRRNKITTTRSFFFLSLCTELRHLYLEGNEVTNMENFPAKVKEMIPTLKFLDCRHLEGLLDKNEPQECVGSNSLKKCSQDRFPTGFIVQFPPKLLVQTPCNTNRKYGI